MKAYVVASGFTIQAVEIAQFIIRSSLDSLFYTGLLRIDNQLNQLLLAFSIGTEVEVFLDPQNDTRQSRQLATTPIRFRVKSIERITAEKDQPAVFQYIDIGLVSAWAFEHAVRSRAIAGTISEIMRQVLADEEFVDSVNSQIETSNDISSPKYQTFESTASFLSKLKYKPISAGSAMYMWGYFDRTINLRSKRAIRGLSDSAVLFPLSFGDAEQQQFQLPPVSEVPYTNVLLAESNIDGGARPRTVYATETIPEDEASELPNELVHQTVETREVILSEIPSQYQGDATIISWDTDPYQAAATGINIASRKEDASATIVAVGPTSTHPFATTIRPGGRISAQLLQGTNLGDGSYMIRSVEYQFNQDTPTQKIVASRIA